MTCVYKEYEVKMKMVQEQWLQLKSGGGGRGRILGRNFSGGEESSKLSAGQKDSPPIPPVGETLEIESFFSILATIVYLYNCTIFHNCIFGF